MAGDDLFLRSRLDLTFAPLNFNSGFLAYSANQTPYQILEIYEYNFQLEKSCSNWQCQCPERSAAAGYLSLLARSAAVTLQDMGMCFNIRHTTPQKNLCYFFSRENLYSHCSSFQFSKYTTPLYKRLPLFLGRSLYLLLGLSVSPAVREDPVLHRQLTSISLPVSVIQNAFNAEAGERCRLHVPVAPSAAQLSTARPPRTKLSGIQIVGPEFT
jgi:hypothetical protein